MQDIRRIKHAKPAAEAYVSVAARKVEPFHCEADEWRCYYEAGLAWRWRGIARCAVIRDSHRAMCRIPASVCLVGACYGHGPTTGQGC